MAVLRRLGAASGRKMNFDGLCVCVCVSRTGCSSVKAVVKDQIWIRGFPGCWNCLKVGTDVIFFRIRLELVCKVVLFFYPECVGNGESPESEAIFTLGDWCLLEFNLCCLLPAIKKNQQNKTEQQQQNLLFVHGFLTKQKSKTQNPYFCLLNCVQHHPREYHQSTLYYLGLYFAILDYLLPLALFIMFFVLLTCQSAFIIFHGSLICVVGWMCEWRLWTVCIGHRWDRSCLNRAVVSMNEAYGRWKSTSSPMPCPSHSVMEADISALLQRECLLCWRLREKVNSF